MKRLDDVTIWKGAILMLFFFLVGLLVGRYVFPMPDGVGAEIFTYQHTAIVSCETNSMYPAMSCNDRLLYRKFNGTVELGKAYMYDRGDKLVVHRAVGCLDLDCVNVIFRGDNNSYNDTAIPKTKIQYVVVGVHYR